MIRLAAALTLAILPAPAAALTEDICREYDIASRSTMEARQSGRVMLGQLIDIANKQPNANVRDLLRDMIFAAWDVPVADTPSAQAAAIDSFVTTQRVVCFERW